MFREDGLIQLAAFEDIVVGVDLTGMMVIEDLLLQDDGVEAVGGNKAEKAWPLMFRTE